MVIDTKKIVLGFSAWNLTLWLALCRGWKGFSSIQCMIWLNYFFCLQLTSQLGFSSLVLDFWKDPEGEEKRNKSERTERECMKDIRERHKVVKVKGKVWKSVEKSESELKAVGGMNNPQTVGEWWVKKRGEMIRVNVEKFGQRKWHFMLMCGNHTVTLWLHYTTHSGMIILRKRTRVRKEVTAAKSPYSCRTFSSNSFFLSPNRLQMLLWKPVGAVWSSLYFSSLLLFLTVVQHHEVCVLSLNKWLFLEQAYYCNIPEKPLAGSPHLTLFFYSPAFIQ